MQNWCVKNALSKHTIRVRELGGPVVGLHDCHLHWYGLEHGPGPSTPLLTTAPWGEMKTGTGITTGRAHP